MSNIQVNINNDYVDACVRLLNLIVNMDLGYVTALEKELKNETDEFLILSYKMSISGSNPEIFLLILNNFLKYSLKGLGDQEYKIKHMQKDIMYALRNASSGMAGLIMLSYVDLKDKNTFIKILKNRLTRDNFERFFTDEDARFGYITSQQKDN